MDNKTVTIIAVASFVIGLILASGLSGKKVPPKADAKELLTQAMQKIESMEQSQKNLQAELERVSASKLASEKKALQETLEKARQDNKKLEEKISTLSGQLAHSELQLDEKEDLMLEIARKNAHIADLEKTNLELKGILDTISSLTTPPGTVIQEHPVAEENKDTVNK